jgi:diguanylate cyclase (GGDEF)-like protein/PAS domain S-box-containing protein
MQQRGRRISRRSVYVTTTVVVLFCAATALHLWRAPLWTVTTLAVCSGCLALAEIRYREVLMARIAESESRRESDLRFRYAFEEAAVGMVILDVEGKIRFVNRGLTDLVLYTPEELIGKPLFSLVHPEDRADIAESRAEILAGKARNYRAERRFRRKDGVTVWIRASVSLLELNGERQTIALVEDITERKQIGEKLRHQATHDQLTGLPNRRELEEVLDIALAAAKSDALKGKGGATNGKPGRGFEVALLYVDLDGFKLVNDTMGHRLGDALLQEVAGRLQEWLEDHQLLARVGGDEFTVVLTGLDGPEVPAATAKRLIACFNEPFRFDGHEISIGASIGISRYPLDGSDANALLQSADAAMYCAKRSGNNRFRFFTAQMREDAHERLTIENHLRRALDNREISVQFQPQYQISTNQLVRFEALCRWHNPTLGQVPPDRFIPVAEETGMIHQLGMHVLRESCKQALEWQGGRQPVQVAVNVSAVQFARVDFVKSVVEILRETGLKPSLLELELTESALVRDREDGIRKMGRLKSIGVRISIDDFGTGYSSLSYLQNMPLDSLKIDRSFTARLGDSPTALSMVRAIIAIARALGLRIVTEGVENSAQVEILRQLGTDDVQGYYFGRPEDGEASVERVARHSMGLVEAETPLAEDLRAIDAAVRGALANSVESLQPSGAPQLP